MVLYNSEGVSNCKNFYISVLALRSSIGCVDVYKVDCEIMDALWKALQPLTGEFLVSSGVVLNLKDRYRYYGFFTSTTDTNQLLTSNSLVLGFRL